MIVVTWNTRALCANLLRGLAPLQADPARRTGGRAQAVRVIVVDNASADGDADALARSFPGVEVLRSERNLGYAGAVALALARSEARRVLLLNSDVELPDGDAIASLMAALEVDPRCGLVGARLLHPDGRDQVGAAGELPGLRALLVHWLGLGHVLPGSRPLYLPPWRARRRARAVGWVCGAVLLARRDALDAAGGLPTDAFLYAEDLRLGAALHAAGYSVRLEPRARAIHHQGGAQGGVPSAAWVSATLDACVGDAPPWARWAARQATARGLALRAAVHELLGRAGLAPRGRRRAAHLRRYAAAAATWGRGGDAELGELP